MVPLPMRQTNQDDPVQLLKRSSPFLGANGVEWTQLVANARVNTFDARSTIYLPGDKSSSIYLLIKGRVLLGHSSESGKRCWLTLIDPGQIFGEQVLVGESSQELCAESLEDSRVLQIPTGPIREQIQQNVSLATAVLQLLGERLALITRIWSRQYYSSMRERLILCLIDLGNRYGQPCHNGVEISLNLSHEDLSGFIGSTRESVTLEIGRLRSAGLLRSTRRQLLLLHFSEWPGLVSSSNS